MGGYDRREYFNNRRRIGYLPRASGIPVEYFVAAKSTSVVSYRTNPTGTPVDIRQADPYAWFLGEVTAQRRAAAKAARKRGSDEQWIVDNGHAFELVRHETTPLMGSATWYPNTSNVGNYISGGPAVTGGCTFNNEGFGRMLFYYAESGSQRAVQGPKAVPPSWNPEYFGNRAITELAPTRPEINLVVSLVEILREGIPFMAASGTMQSVMGIFRHAEKSALIGRKPTLSDLLEFWDTGNLIAGVSKDYLNLSFGIMPLIRDLDALVQIMSRTRDILLQYSTDAGKGVRRSKTFVDEKKVQTFDFSQFSSPANVGVLPAMFPKYFGSTSSSNDNGTSTRSTQVTQVLYEKIRFSGSFSYYLPRRSESDNWEANIEVWRRLLGEPFSIEALWNLFPWSWAIDWQLDVSTLIASAEAYKDKNLVMNYGYLMREVRCTTLVETVAQQTSIPKGEKATRVFRTRYSTTKLERIRANPFGFSFKTPSALDGHQLSLLAATGFAR